VIPIFLYGTVYASTENYWSQKTQECGGNLDLMLKEIADAEAIPHFRTDRSPEELFQVLKTAGRFHELDLNDREGEILVKAVFEKMGLTDSDPEEFRPAENRANPEELNAISFRAGTEFEELAAVLMRWPFDWAGMRDEWADMIDAMQYSGAKLYIWVNSSTQKNAAIDYLNQNGVPHDHCKWVVERTNSVWIRDYGPQFLYHNTSNAWGLADFHYSNSRPYDDDTPLFIAEMMDVPRMNRQSSNIVYTEGGNLNHDGLGSVTYSQRTYNKNGGTDPAIIDQRIMSAFQAHQNLVPQDPSLDMTGHCDMFQKILDETTVMVAQYDSDETDYQVLEDCATMYEGAVNGAGEPWNVVRIRQPDVYYIYFVLPVVRTYTNAFITNNVILFPMFGIADDSDAAALYESLLPGRTIYPVDASVIIESGGAWHCVTMEFPNPNNPD
jgi:agmatine deiminase